MKLKPDQWCKIQLAMANLYVRLHDHPRLRLRADHIPGVFSIVVASP